MTKDDNKQSIIPIYKGIRLRRFRSIDGGYKDGVRLTSKKEIGIVFPFERDHDGIVDGIKTILGYQYSKWIFNYWVPKIIKLKELLFLRKNVVIKGSQIDLSETLDALSFDKSSFFKRVKKNYVYDYSSILGTIFPKFDDVSRWNQTRAYNNIDNFIKEWLNFIITSPKNSDNKVIKTSIFRYGSGVNDLHENILMGLKVNSSNPIFSRYIDPSIKIPRIVKVNLNNYIPILLLRSIAAGCMGYKEDPMLIDIFNIIKDFSIVFYNNRGIGFIFNTKDDDNVVNLKPMQLIERFRALFKKLAISNDVNYVDDPNDKEIYDGDESISSDNTQKEPTEDKEFDEIIDKVVDSKIVSKIVDKKISKIQKKRLKNEIDEVIEEENDNNDEELENTDDENEFEEIEQEIDSEIDEEIEDEIEDEKEKESDVKDLLSSLDKENKPTKTPAQIQRLKILEEKYKSLNVDGRSLQEILEDSKSKKIDREIPNTTILDESVKGSLLVDFEKSYVNNTMEYDILNTIKSFSDNKSINLHMVDVMKEDTSDQNTAKFTYSFKLVDEENRRHNIKVDIPKIDKDGFLLIGGNKKILKKQLTLLPIVKCTPDRVMMTSNYNKCFIYRSGNVITRGMSALNKLLGKELLNNSKFEYYKGDNRKENKEFITNIEYDVLSWRYQKFIIGKPKRNSCEYLFNQHELRSIIRENFKDYKFSSKILPIGIDWKNNKVIDIDLTGSESVSDKIISDIQRYNIVENIDSMLNTMNIAKRRMYTKIELQSRDFALISFLGALFGLSKVINTEKIDVEFVEKKIVGDKRLYIRFSDGYLYYKDTNISSSLLLNGLSYMSPEDYSIADFDTERPYIDYFYNVSKSRNIFKGHTAFKDLFIDKITEEVLRDLNLPTDFLELFLYANSLLSDNAYTSETSLENYRIRGYENISVILYKTIASQYRLFKQNSIKNGRISIQQDQIMVGLHKSFILENYDATNPVNELKSKSIVTFKGPGGINSDRVFNLEKRSMDISGVGTIAISSTDSGSVGITKQLTMNPNIISTRGYINPTKDKKDIKNSKLGNIASPEEADVAFVSFHDDPKRIGFTSGQTKHLIKVKGSSFPVVSTGMDKITPSLVGNTYVPKAQKNGTVEKVDIGNNILIIRYDDGTAESVAIGLDIQRNSSFFFGNNLIPNVKEGQPVKKGDILAYEEDFFKKDVFGNIRNSQGVLAKLVLQEKSTTDDDSSAITESLSEKLGTNIVMRKQISISKDANIISYKKIGEKVLKGDPLFVFEDSGDDMTNELMDSLGDIDEEILAMAKQIPKANVTGEIVDIKVYFTVPLEEVSDSIYKFILNWSKDIKKKIKIEKSYSVNNRDRDILLKPTKPMQAGSDSRINGAIISEEGGVLIEYYINHIQGMGVGDKITFNSNIKSVLAAIIPDGKEPITEDGIKLDGTIGLISVQARMCYSPLMNGVMSHVLVEKSKSIAKKYLES